jgi:DNA (cytosine-5)-methyltransferase 1
MKHGSLFSGIGGFDLAAEWMGWDNVFHCEIEEYQRGELNNNFPKAISFKDIKDIDGTQFTNSIDIISGGFPCQDISIANTYNGGGQGIKGERSGLWQEYARLIREIRPKYIVFENSPMLVNRGLEHVLCDLSRMGYDAEWRMFYATQFGFNHRRKRIYGIAYSKQIGCENNFEQGGILSKILQQKPSRQNPLSMPFERFNSKSDYGHIRMDDGFSKELDKKVIESYGNAIIPIIAFEIFKAIQQHDDSL